MTSPATVTMIAAVFNTPQRNALIVSGTERIHGQRAFCDVTFFHELNITQPDHLTVSGGDVVHLTASLTPHPKEYGRVQLHVTDLTVIGATSARNKRDTGYQAPFGYTLLTATGTVASPPRTQTFGDGEMVTNFVLRLPGMPGLLEGSGYNLTAHAAAQLQQGEQVRLQGRLLSRKRPTGNGQWNVYTKLELPRQQAAHLKVSPRRTLAAAQ